MNDLIVQLREERIRQGLTQAELADAIGVNTSSLKAWERTYQQPGLSKAQAWAHALGRRLVLEDDVRDLSALLAEADTDSLALVEAENAAVSRDFKPLRRRVEQHRSGASGRYVSAGEVDADAVDDD